MEQQMKKWLEKNTSYDINPIVLNDDTFVFEINGQEFTINKQIQSKKIYYIVIGDISNKWIDDLNFYSIKKSLNELKVLEKIVKMVSQNKYKMIVEETKPVSIATVKKEPMTQMEIYRERIRLDTLSKDLEITSEQIEGVTQMFPKNVVVDILINEYINVLTKMPHIDIELKNNNLCSWQIQISDFDNTRLIDDLSIMNSMYGYNGIIVNIDFNGIYYPNIPPKVYITRPKLANSIMHKITNFKMFQLEYWDSSTRVETIIDTLRSILNKHAKIEIDHPLNNPYKSDLTNYDTIEMLLFDFASNSNSQMVNEIESDFTFTKIIDIQKKANEQKTTTTAVKTNGVGYGSTEKWDFDEYLKIQEDKSKKMEKNISEIYELIKKSSESEKKVFLSCVSDSLLISHIKNNIINTNLLDIEKNINLYQLYFNVLELFNTPDGIHIFDDEKDQSKSLFSIIGKFNKECSPLFKVDSENKLANMILMFFSSIEPLFSNYIEYKKMTEKKEEHIITTDTIVAKKTKEDIFCEKMKDMNYGTVEINKKNYYYVEKLNNKLSISAMTRISIEMTTLSNSNLVDYKSSIFVRIDESKMNCIKALITGPIDTPYANGCFIFDVYLPSDYPNSCPEIHFVNTGGKRFNPNLYDCGKVCLSILNTYIGPVLTESEKWNPKTSNLLQALVSIQSQILTEEPWFNEPGRERYVGTDSGKRESIAHNLTLKLYTIEHTIYDVLANIKSYGEFSDVIKTYFKLKKDDIIEKITEWSKTYTDVSRIDHIKKLLEKIKLELDVL